MRNVFPMIEGRHSVPYGSERLFNNFAPLADNIKVVISNVNEFISAVADMLAARRRLPKVLL
jgi:hypothetical protein